MPNSDLLPKPCWPSRDDSTKSPESWFCIFCEGENHWDHLECHGCERPRYYQLTQRQARAVARKLNRLAYLSAKFQQLNDGWQRDIRYWVSDLRESMERKYQLDAMYKLQPCGHERRFIVTGDDKDIDPKGKSDRGKSGWCVLCELQGVRTSNEALLDKMTISLKEATDAREL